MIPICDEGIGHVSGKVLFHEGFLPCVETTWGFYINALRTRWNRDRFVNAFKCIFLDENIWISIKIALTHDDVIKESIKAPGYWPLVRGIHRSPLISPHRGQWRGALMFSLICALNKRLCKHSWGWWFETPLCSLWCNCNGLFLRFELAVFQFWFR